MNTASEQRVGMVSQKTLMPLVRCALADETATVVDWSHQSLEGGFSGSAVYRFQGQAQTADGIKPWSLILKVISPAAGWAAPADFDYWKREMLLYQSGLLADLPTDLVAPCCFDIIEYPGVEYPEEEVWLWLEDMGAAEDKEWALERFSP